MQELLLKMEVFLRRTKKCLLITADFRPVKFISVYQFKNDNTEGTITITQKEADS